jgi:signal transduction histidine kinase
MTFQRPAPLRTQLEAIIDRCLPLASATPEQRNDLFIELEYAFETAKLESLAEFAAGAGHEINNPVATIAGRAQLLLSGESDPERRSALQIIGGQALRIRDMIGDVMLFARPPEPRLELVELLPIIRQAIESQAELRAKHAPTITPKVPAQLTLQGDRTQLQVLLSSLVRNSLEAADRPGIQITIETRPETQDARQGTVISVSDDGPGLSAEDRTHLFDPFYSGRPAGRGLGFGLSKCWRIARQHGGELRLKPTEGRGVTLEVWWPTKTEHNAFAVAGRNLFLNFNANSTSLLRARSVRGANNDYGLPADYEAGCSVAFRRSLRSKSRRAFTSSPISPWMIVSRRCMVRPIRWSVTRFCGKL